MAAAPLTPLVAVPRVDGGGWIVAESLRTAWPLTTLMLAFVTIVLVEAIGALVAPAGVAPDVKDVERMRAYLLALPLSAYAFLLLAYLVGSVVGGAVAGRVVQHPGSRVVWVVGGVLLATTVANLVLIAHPLWFSIAAVVAIFVGTGFSTTFRPATAR